MKPDNKRSGNEKKNRPGGPGKQSSGSKKYGTPRSGSSSSGGKKNQPGEYRDRPAGEKSGKSTGYSGKSKYSGEKHSKDSKPLAGKSQPEKPRGRKSTGSENGPVRLNKIIAHAGICSRREADTLIQAGLISVNGKIVTEVGTKVSPDDDIRYNGERLGNERKVYLLLNKPKDYVTTLDDPHAKKTVMDLVGRACKERIYPVGRLDKNTTGVLLFTNDGDLTRKLTHPSFNKKKIYHVHLDRNLQYIDMKKIAEGMELEDGPVNVDAIAYANAENKKEIGLEIHSGKNRIVRRIFESLDYKVMKLDRVYFAGLTKKDLPRGRWRFLTDKEIKMLKTNAFE